jgi:hypothetical protein
VGGLTVGTLTVGTLAVGTSVDGVLTVGTLVDGTGGGEGCFTTTGVVVDAAFGVAATAGADGDDAAV